MDEHLQVNINESVNECETRCHSLLQQLYNECSLAYFPFLNRSQADVLTEQRMAAVVYAFIRKYRANTRGAYRREEVPGFKENS